MHKDKQKALDAEINDMLLDDIDKFEHFAANNWKGIIIGFIAVFIAVVIVAIGYQVNNSMKSSAVNTISAAETKEALEKVVRDYASYPAVNSARIKLAILYIKDKNYDKAIELYSIIRNSADTPDEMRWRAALNVSYVTELKGQKEEAASGFATTASQSTMSDAFRAEANYAAGRLYASFNNKEKAAGFLKTASLSALAPGAAGFWGDLAKLLLERLDAQTAVN